MTRIHVCTNGILWIASCCLFYLAHCSKYCWLNFVFVQGSEFGLAAMAEVVVERPGTIFIGDCQSGCQRSWACVALQVDFCWCWAHVRVAWSRLALHMLGIWCLSWKKSWRETVTSGMWHMKGGLFQMPEGEQELEKRAAVFRTSASFWEDGVHEWETNNVRSRATYAESAEERAVASIWLHGLHTPMRCSCGTSNSFAFLDSTAFWRGGLMRVVCVCVCVCVELQAFCIFGLHCLLAGRSRCTEGDDI